MKPAFAASTRLAAAAVLVCAFTAEAASSNGDTTPSSLAHKKVAGASAASFETFLDRLMRAESDGRDFLANPRSTALGPFQFIKGTFIEVTRRHFAAEVAHLTEEQILALRTDRPFSRRAAAAYCRESAAYLSEQRLEPTFAHLRLAYLVGPHGAIRLLQSASTAPVSELLGPSVLKANPFMAGMTAADLIARTARDVSAHGNDGAPAPRVRTTLASPAKRTARHPQGRRAEKVRCNAKLPSCRRWIALRAHRLAEGRGADRGQPRKGTKG